MGTVVTPVVGNNTTDELELELNPPTVGTSNPGPAGGLAELDAVNVATVASTVAKATPDPASTTRARDLARLSAGGAICALWP
ncbi:MAG TPA: hypothetical protein VH352_01490 [Pseudonocardiaceae bacterium]|nr:hypothetical protein [Pseudonocardiaceae bacterium]